MKNFDLIEMAKAMKEHKLRHMWRYAAMMALLLTLTCGQVWGDTTLFSTEFNNAVWSGKTFSQGNTTTPHVYNGITFYCKSGSTQLWGTERKVHRGKLEMLVNKRVTRITTKNELCICLA
ncbi:MAG: hypothetical protein IJQ32_00190 [Paludibacteraceae bacterium]|nr:hypothetical protein [Paludibacteraceae bacterium]